MSKLSSAPLRWAIGFSLLHVVLVAVVSTRGFFGVLTRISPETLNRSNLLDDVQNHYFLYAQQSLHQGRIPYRDFAVQYPPVAIPLFLLPYPLAPTVRGYPYAFALEMMAINAVIVALVAARVAAREGQGRVARRLGWYSLCVATFGCLMITRYDLAPTLLAFAGMLMWTGNRVVPAGAVLGLGVLTKIFPGALAGPAWLATRPTGRGIAGVAAVVLTVLLGLGAWHLLSAGRAVESIRYHSERGLEVGSVYSGVLALASRIGGFPLKDEYLHSSWELTGALAGRTAALVPPIQIAALLLVLVRYRWSGLAVLPWSSAAILVAFILTGKVLSPQYLIWLLPFLAVLEGPRAVGARRLYLACCLVTFAVFPMLFVELCRFGLLALIVLNVRNALLAALLVWLLRGPFDPSGATEPPGSPSA